MTRSRNMRNLGICNLYRVERKFELQKSKLFENFLLGTICAGSLSNAKNRQQLVTTIITTYELRL